MLRLLTLGGLDLRDAQDVAHPLLAQPKRLGLLVFLATAGADGVRRRDILLSHFWPELDEVRARGALRQATYVLRRSLGDGVIVMRGDDELGTDSREFWTDVTAFESAMNAGDMRAAAELYRGDFLDGFFVSGASSAFDDWVAAERQRLRRLAAHAVWTVANDLSASEPTAATEWIRRTIALAPDDELTVRQALLLLDQIGDRSGALQLYHDFCARLAREYDAQPAAETLAIGDNLRRSVAPTTRSNSPDAVSPTPIEPTAVSLRDNVKSASPQARARRRSGIAIAAIAGIAAISLAAWTARQRPDVLSAPMVSAVTDELLIGDITTSAGKRDVARALTEWLRASLTQTTAMRIVSRDSLLRALRRAGYDSATAGDAAALRDVAVRNGYEAFLSAELTPIGNGYLLSARVLSATGRELSSATENAESEDALVRAAARLARKLHNGGLSERVIGSANSLERVSTPSLKALMRFSEAQRQSPLLGSQSAPVVALLREAVALDTTFAMAHRRLGMAVFNLGLMREAMSELRAAVRFAEQLTDVEERMANSSLHGLLGERERAAAEALEILAIEPVNQWAIYQLGYQFLMMGEYDRAEREVGSRKNQQDPGLTPFWSYIRAYQGRPAEALDSARARLNRLSDSVGTRFWHDARARVAMFHALQHSYDSALIYAAAEPPPNGWAPLVLASSQFTRGQFKDAIRTQQRRQLDASGEGPPASGTPRVAVESFNALAMFIAGIDAREARRHLAAALADSGYRERQPVDRHIRPILAMSLAGDAAKARRALSAMEESAGPDERALRAGDFVMARGAVALAEGRARLAVDELTKASHFNLWASQDVCRVCALPWLGRAYEAAGKPDSALITYERFLTTGDPFRLLADAAWYAVVLQRTAELHRQRGDTAQSIKRLTEFTTLWADADPELQPAVRRARATLVALQRTATAVAASPPTSR